MINHTQNRDFKLPRMFEINGAFFAPDADDVELELLSAEGVVITQGFWGFDESDDWIIPASFFTVAPEVYSTDLFLQVKFIANGELHLFSDHLRVIRFKPITVTANALRLALGANAEEMPDETFDIYGAYVEISERIGRDLFADLTKSRVSNRLITLKCLLSQIPTLQLRLMQSRAVDDHKFTRAKVNYDQLKGDLLSEYETLLGTEFGFEEPIDAEPLLTIIGRTDPFAGE